jgi:hypothetical protein
MASTVEKGGTFRDVVVSMLEAAGFAAETETREDFKKVDARWLRQEIDGLVKSYVETKDYAGILGKAECLEFLSEYGTLVENGHADRAWLVSKGPISPDGRAAIDAKRGLKALTFAEFQRRILGLRWLPARASGQVRNGGHRQLVCPSTHRCWRRTGRGGAGLDR